MKPTAPQSFDSIAARARCWLASLLLGAAPVLAQAGNDVPPPLRIDNASPVVGIFAIPTAHGTALAGAGETKLNLDLDVTSHFVESGNGGERILFDGETARLILAAQYGLDDDWNIGVEVPWLRHGGGFMDGFIIDWHDLWGFDQSGRDTAPRDRIAYRYRRDGVTRLKMTDAQDGIGDIVLSARRRVLDRPASAAVLHTQLKLPTGDADKLTGSGAADAAAGLEWSRQWRPGWSSSLRAGLAYLGDGEVLPELQRDWAAYGGADLVWQPWRGLALRLQYDAHTAPFRDSELKELSDWSGMLTAGGGWRITPDTALDFALVENVPNTFVVPDVTFKLRLRTRLGAGP